MKYLILVLIIAGGYYYYQNNSPLDIDVTDYASLLSKVEKTNVTLAEVILGANKLAGYFCNDSDFQTSGASSVQACLKRFDEFKVMCEERVFESAAAVFKSKNEFIPYVKRYRKCVSPGISD